MPRAEGSTHTQPLLGRASQADNLRVSAVTFDTPFGSDLRGAGGRSGLSFRQEAAMTCVVSALCTLLLLYLMPSDEESLGMANPNERGGTEVEKCGNGVIDYALREQCDDGNMWSGDGCSGVDKNQASRLPCQLEQPQGSNCNENTTGVRCRTDSKSVRHVHCFACRVRMCSCLASDISLGLPRRTLLSAGKATFLRS